MFGALDAQQLLLQSPTFTCYLRGPDHVYDMANAAYERLVGNRPLIGKTVREALPEVEGQGIFELLDWVYRRGEPFVGQEMPLEWDRAGDGVLRSGYLTFLYQPIRQADGVQGILVQGYDVSELVETRMRAERLATSLRERDELLHAAQEISPIPIAYLRILRDAQGHAVDFEYLFQNAAASRANGLGVGLSCAGRRLLEVFPTMRSSPLFARYREVADTGTPFRGEERHAGERRDSWYRVAVVRPSADTLTVSFEDVTTERRLRERLAGMHQLATALSAARSTEEVANVAVGVGAEIIGATTAVFATQEEDGRRRIVASRDIEEASRVIASDLPRGFALPVQEAMDSGQPAFAETASELSARFPEFARLATTAHGAALALPLTVGDRVLGALGFRFVKERRFDEDERAFMLAFASQVAQAYERAALYDATVSARAELERQKARLDVMLSEMPVGMMVISRDGRLELQNRAASEIWGLTGSFEPTSNRYQRYEAFHPDGTQVSPDEWPSRCILRGEAYAPREVRIIRMDGSSGWVAFNAAPVLAADGTVDAALVVLSDVTRLKEAEAHASAAREEAQRANLAKDEFLAMLGHELRNPLAPISTALTLMRNRDGDAFGRERAVIERQVTHLERLVDDLLDISRITRGKLELRSERVAVADVVSDAIEATSPLFDKHGHHLSVELASERIEVMGDPARLRQTVSNLLTNAAKYTEPGGRIDVAVRRDGADVVLSVRDSGIGISPDLLPRVFELFTQGRQTSDRSEGGLGLGLAIVRTLVTAHGGTVEARSEGVGRGSEFVIRLPALAAAVMTNVPASAEPVALGTSRKRRVMVVDDNQDLAEMLCELLRDVGHEVEVAHDGPDALSKSNAFRPEIVVLDIGLPVMDGYELARKLRVSEMGKQLKLVALSGYGQEQDRARSRDAGIDVHLVKPIQADALLGAID